MILGVNARDYLRDVVSVSLPNRMRQHRTEANGRSPSVVTSVLGQGVFFRRRLYPRDGLGSVRLVIRPPFFGELAAPVWGWQI